MHHKWQMVVLCSGLLLVGTLFAQQKQGMKSQDKVLNSAERQFVSSAEEANLAEIETAKMVEQKSTDAAIKGFASRMVTDHTRASQDLSTLAEMNGIKLPTQPDATERAQKDELQKLSGNKLDDAYLSDELQGHKKVIAEFEKEVDQGQDAAVKNYAQQTLPTLQDHIRIAENVAGKIGMSGKAGLNDEAKSIVSR